MKKYQEMDEEVKELEKQIYELSQKRNSIGREADKLFVKYKKNEVGRCFKSNDDDVYVKIIDVPHPEKYGGYYYSGHRFNYPALYIYCFAEGYDGAPFKFDIINSVDYSSSDYTEISKEEFNWTFWRAIDMITEDAVICEEEDE